MAFNYGDYARQIILSTDNQMKQDLSKIFKIMNGSAALTQTL